MREREEKTPKYFKPMYLVAKEQMTAVFFSKSSTILGLEFRSEKQVTSSINRNTFFDAAIEKCPIHEVANILIFETVEKIYNI